MLNTKSINQIVFLDIECAPIYETFADLPPKLKTLFAEKYATQIGEIAYAATSTGGQDIKKAYELAYNDVYKEKAVLSPEFSQIICISAGMIVDGKFKGLSYSGATDKEILSNFIEKSKFIHQKLGDKEAQSICVYNSGFDIPFLSRRILYNGLPLPSRLDTEGIKPWDLLYLIDPKNELKFTGYDVPSLELLCTTLGIQTAQDIHGDPSQLAGKHKSGDFKFIEDYCMADVFALAEAYQKLHRSPQHPNGIINQLTK